MKKLISIFMLTLSLMVLSCAARHQSAAAPERGEAGAGIAAAADVTFNFTRLSGRASNQFAIWIENAQGQYVKTLYAARWTANGGWRTRPTSIPMWIARSGAANMSRARIDSVSGATPAAGALTYIWNGTDSLGEAVPDGDYTLILEGTLRWENQVYYRAPIALGGGAADAEVSVEYIGDAAEDRAMIGNVRVRTLR